VNVFDDYLVSSVIVGRIASRRTSRTSRPKYRRVALSDLGYIVSIADPRFCAPTVARLIQCLV
jgi:hypothetical protein